MKRYSVLYQGEVIAEVMDMGKGFEELLRSLEITLKEWEDLPEVPISPPKHAVWLD